MAAATSLLLYGLLSITVVSLSSLVGGLIIPCTSGKSRRLWMHFFIAMAVGTLSSDSVLHLIPEVLGLHNHDGHSHHHEVVIENVTKTVEGVTEHHHHDHAHDHKQGDDSHEGHDHIEHGHDSHEVTAGTTPREKRHAHDDDHHGHGHSHDAHDHSSISSERQLLLKLLCLLLAVYALYLIEFVTYFRTDGGHSHGHSHDTVGDHSPGYEAKSVAGWDVESACPSSSSTSVAPVAGNQVSPLIAAPPVMCGLRGPALIILFGDGVHNFIDGVAIGASFATGPGTGLATSIAVLCHELPHELGDMAVLLETGLSMTKALILNLLSAFTAYAGLFVGFYAVSIDSAKTWLLALTAGMFLYVAWIDMLSHLKHEAAERLDPWWLTCLLQFLGLLVGTALMFCLGWFEHDIFEF